MKVYVQDGPAAGRIVTYSRPLPEVLVIAQPADGRLFPEYHDYQRNRDRGCYQHARTCSCRGRLSAAPAVAL